MGYTKIKAGTIYDPANGVDGVVGDLWIRDGKIVDPPADATAPANIIDASGMVVMPGGIDVHCHIAGPKVNSARKLRPEEKRRDAPVKRMGKLHSGTMGSVPSSFATGYKYAALGYTTAFDAAVPPLSARHVLEEFADTPCLDKGFFVLAGNNHFILDSIKRNDADRLTGFLAWLIGSTRAYAPKIVNPGGVEMWKQKPTGNARDLDVPIDHFDVSPRQIIQSIARASNRLGLPHPIHIHCNNLGMPGNWTTTLETMKTLEGQRGHMAHIQFHSYGGGDADENTFSSKVEPLAEYVNQHPNISVDVGQIMFGPTTSMTGDGPLGYYLHQVYGSKWISADTELETGCGIAPIEYRNTSFVHALQWAVGLEWFLMVKDPWQVAMSTDHPNGASFLSYPQIIHLLMDRGFRREALKTVNPKIRKCTQLESLDREYSLYEIAIITRAGPARMLGLKDKGHLAPGADADITIYLPNADKQQMFELPNYVIKAGRVMSERGEILEPLEGETLFVRPSFDQGLVPAIEQWFDDFYSIRFRNYPIQQDFALREVPVLNSGN